MGMSIDKTIEFFNGLECHTPQAKDARDIAVDTMRKYQKIEQVLNDWREMGYNENDGLYTLISGVVEDGNDEEILEDKDIILEIDRETLLQEYIPKDQYETRLKSDLMAMLTEIQLEIEESTVENEEYRNSHVQNGIRLGKHLSSAIIQEKINALERELCANKNGCAYCSLEEEDCCRKLYEETMRED